MFTGALILVAGLALLLGAKAAYEWMAETFGYPQFRHPVLIWGARLVAASWVALALYMLWPR